MYCSLKTTYASYSKHRKTVHVSTPKPFRSLPLGLDRKTKPDEGFNHKYPFNLKEMFEYVPNAKAIALSKIQRHQALRNLTVYGTLKLNKLRGD